MGANPRVRRRGRARHLHPVRPAPRRCATSRARARFSALRPSGSGAFASSAARASRSASSPGIDQRIARTREASLSTTDASPSSRMAKRVGTRPAGAVEERCCKSPATPTSPISLISSSKGAGAMAPGGAGTVNDASRPAATPAARARSSFEKAFFGTFVLDFFAKTSLLRYTSQGLHHRGVRPALSRRTPRSPAAAPRFPGDHMRLRFAHCGDFHLGYDFDYLPPAQSGGAPGRPAHGVFSLRP